MSADATFPVQVLREHSTALEAALSVCLADPGHKAVHKLRTETRRLEAELLLLAQLPETPEHRNETTALLKELKRLRRAAGQVRDLDVHRKLLDRYIEPAEEPGRDAARNGTVAPSGSRETGKDRAGNRQGKSHKSTAPATQNGASAPASSALQSGAENLRAHMGKQRDHAALELRKLLGKRQTKAAAAAEALLKVLRQAEDLPLSLEDLLQHARAVLERDHLLDRGDVDKLSGKELHRVRKSAKAARYLAETVPDNPVSAEAARRFEAVQEAGGQWHDLLELARASRRFLSKAHELTVTLTEERDRAREAYGEALGQFAAEGSQSSKKGTPKPKRLSSGRQSSKKQSSS